MSLNKILLFATLVLGIYSCKQKTPSTTISQVDMPIQGTWKLLKGTLIEKGDTTITDYTKDISFIKIINESHFAFFSHDLNKGKDSLAVYSSGGGKYTLKEDAYTEYLEYCTAREWEQNEFKFKLTLKNDTLTQTGVEVVESAGVNRINTEVYVREK
jgi:predicted small secreted protein